MWATCTLIAKLDSWPAVSLRLVYGIMDGLGIFAGAGQVDFIAQHRVSSHSASFVLLCFVLLLDRSLFSFLSGSTILLGTIPRAHQLLLIKTVTYKNSSDW